MIYAMVYQSLSILVSKTASQGDGAQSEEWVGEILSAVAQVYIFNGITKFTSTWFGGKQRAFATAFILMFHVLGNYTPAWIKMVYRANEIIVKEGTLGQLPIPDNVTSIYTIMDRF